MNRLAVDGTLGVKDGKINLTIETFVCRGVGTKRKAFKEETAWRHVHSCFSGTTARLR